MLARWIGQLVGAMWLAGRLTVSASPFDIAPLGFPLTVTSVASNTSPLVMDEVWIEFLARDAAADSLFRPLRDDLALVSLDLSGIAEPMPAGVLAFDPFAGMSDEALEAITALFPDSGALWMEKSRRAYHRGDLDASFRFAERAVQLDPGNLDHFNYFSGILVLSGRYELAVDLLSGAIMEQPFNVLLRFNLACALARVGAIDASVSQLLTLHRMGWDNLLYYLGDRDLDPIRAHPGFLALENRLLDQPRVKATVSEVEIPPLAPALR